MAKRLDLSGKPRWVVIDPDLSLQVQPMSPAQLRAVVPSLADLKPEDGAVDPAKADAGFDLLLDMIEAHVVGWTVEDLEGQPAPVSRAAAEALLVAEPDLAGPIMSAIMGRAVAQAEVLRDEGNASAPLRNGTSAGAPNTAGTAKAPAPTARAG